VILGHPQDSNGPASDPTTLDALFRRAAVRRPAALALADPPNRAFAMPGPPRRFTYAEADRIVSAIAAQLRQLGLPTDAVVAIQLPNTVECALTLLGILRAGMIVAPLPFLWRRVDTVPVLERLGAKAIIGGGCLDGDELLADIVQAATKVFSIRHVCGFGRNLPDGVLAFDDLLSAAPDELSFVKRDQNPGAHVAVVTGEMTSQGPAIMARSHLELIAGGLATVLEGGLRQETHMLCACAIGSFAGLALTITPWLLTGGALSLHHGFDASSFASQCRDDRCDTIVAPAPLLPRLAEAELLHHAELKNVLGVWRALESFAGSPPWQMANIAMTDMLAFGEIALLGSRRGTSGEPVPLPTGRISAPRGAAGGVALAEMTRTANGSVAIRGPMVPRYAFPPGSDGNDPTGLRSDPAGFVDTRYPCRVDAATGTFVVTGPPPGVVAIGGYRFARDELEQQASRAEDGAFLTALPDALAGQRLAGITARANAGTRLAELGVNPLLAEAFARRDRPAA
jgi:non-ribosomal peptide synthetase component E (peptide arylation enzyme)